MRTCNYKGTILLFLIFASSNLFSQSISMPEMPSSSSISSPAMPTLVSPTIGSNFYVPGAKIKNQTSVTKQQNITQNNVISKNSTEQTTLDKILSSRISAQDLTSLEDSGMFSSIYGLLNNSQSNQTQIPTEKMLNDILSELNELKEYTKKQELQNIHTEKNHSQNNTSPKILRFLVNGNNVLNTCRTIHFSKKEKDGTFLLTGDRKYSNNNITRDETFYFLFKPNKNNSSTTEYQVVPNIIQDSKNEQSILFNFTKEPNLIATKTGNLISVRNSADNMNIDLLLDIGE